MKHLVILVSGSGTNLQKIIEVVNRGDLPDTKISLVIADRDCYALERAINHDITTFLLDRNKDELSEDIHQIISAILQDKDILIIMAGFLSILSKEFCDIYAGKIINIHPSLLPKYGGKGMYGNKVHQAVLDNQEAESGATVHYVTNEIDKGDIIIQKSCPISSNDTYETLAQKIHQIEHQILIEAIRKIKNN